MRAPATLVENGFAANAMSTQKKMTIAISVAMTYGWSSRYFALEPPDARADVHAEEEEPPEERAVLPAPERGEQVKRSSSSDRSSGDVPDAEIVGDERVGEAQDGEPDEGHRAVGAEARGLEVAGPTSSGDDRDREGVGGGDHHRVEDELSEQG